MCSIYLLTIMRVEKFMMVSVYTVLKFSKAVRSYAQFDVDAR